MTWGLVSLSGGGAQMTIPTSGSRRRTAEHGGAERVLIADKGEGSESLSRESFICFDTKS